MRQTAFALLLVPALATAASAASVQYSAPINVHLECVGSQTLDPENITTINCTWFELNKFNPSLGTLEEVLLTLHDGLQVTTLEFHNNTANANAGIAFRANNIFAAHLNEDQDNPLINLPYMIATPAYPAYQKPGAHQTYTASWNTTLPDFSQTYTSPQLLSTFVGTGYVILDGDFDSTATVKTSPVANSYTITTNTFLTATVKYTYTPTIIPEPATITLSLALASLLPFVRPARRG